ncbi:MAG TPA: alpha/beta hydrolase [Methanocella sp.]|nr:alpha/beta hydrolase [Methanocella sp.]
MPDRRFIDANGIRLSYFDYGGSGKPLLMLHGHYSCARSFAWLAEQLHDRWRVVTIDQRGHGWSDHTEDYSREAYVSDTAVFIEKLGIAQAVVLGHSLGGLNAYQLAAKRPELVQALVIEDVGAVVPIFPPATEGWPLRFRNMGQVQDWAAEKGFKEDAYFQESLVEYPDGWGFRFDYDRVDRSMRQIAGDWWQDWLGSKCPALLLHGHRSWVLNTDHAREMAGRRPGTSLVEFPECGHTIHDEEPGGFYRAVAGFLERFHK